MAQKDKAQHEHIVLSRSKFRVRAQLICGRSQPTLQLFQVFQWMVM